MLHSAHLFYDFQIVVTLLLDTALRGGLTIKGIDS